MKYLYPEILIAIRYLRSKRKERFTSVITLFSLLGIILGVAALIVVMSVMNGFRVELTKKIMGAQGHIAVYSKKGFLYDYDNVIKAIPANNEIKQITAVIDGQVMATSKNYSTGVYVRGISSKDLMDKPLIANNIIAGKINDFEGDNIIIGNELANTLRVEVGDKLTLISPRNSTTVAGIVPRIKAYKVSGIFFSGMYQYDSSLMFLPLPAAQLLFKLHNQVTQIELMLDNAEKAPEIARNIESYLPELRVVDWKQKNSSMLNALEIERVVMFLILTLIIIVAAFNIISSLIMMVQDKTASIAIMRTIGVSRGAVMRIFFYSGSIIGVIGTFFGFALGLLFSLNIEKIRVFLESLTGARIFDPVIYYLSNLPADVRAEDVAKVVILSLVLSFIATIYPAYKASKLNPVEALRYE